MSQVGEDRRVLLSMTLEELWQLFPIELVEHRDEWAEWYSEEARRLSEHLPKGARVSHIGSTAVPGIMAKPIVDILVEVVESESLEAVASEIEGAGYIVMARSEGRVDLNRGYTSKGFADRVFHLHLRHMGDCDELYFRNFLIGHPVVAREYEALKLKLWREFEHDRDAYTAGKGEFVRTWTEEGKKEVRLTEGS